jgi:XrtJ-associated TM-motif-TM protein
MKLSPVVLLLLVVLLVPAVASAQTGCLDSPECPTAVLGAVGAAAAMLYSRLRRR